MVVFKNDHFVLKTKKTRRTKKRSILRNENKNINNTKNDSLLERFFLTINNPTFTVLFNNRIVIID